MAKRGVKRVQPQPKEIWKNEPDNHDYPSAFDFLTLISSATVSNSLVERLREAEITIRQAKDILRASGLPLLPKNDFHVSLDLKKVSKGVSLSPVLLIRGSLSKQANLVIADGYHRVCASYHLSENENIPCKIADSGISTRRS